MPHNLVGSALHSAAQITNPFPVHAFGIHQAAKIVHLGGQQAVDPFQPLQAVVRAFVFVDAPHLVAAVFQ